MKQTMDFTARPSAATKGQQVIFSRKGAKTQRKIMCGLCFDNSVFFASFAPLG
jgi:hypothetical protein